ncbi:MAG TPA: cytochrome c oxidase subunit II [Beijerinckiaceae bacterium]|jgi:cytochrome c oxidase subunit 2
MRTKSIGHRLAARLAMAGLALALGSTAALAAGTGQPEPWQIAMQNPMTELAQGVHNFHTWLVWIITAISFFVLALLIAVVVKFNERANPVPSRTTHNTLIEVAWTIVPVLILVAIAIPSFRLLREQLIIPKADVVVKATGMNGWYWTYEYPADQGGFKFESFMLDEAKRAEAIKAGANAPRLLAVDNEMVVPLNKVVKVQVTAEGVLHAFALPSFGIKIDAVPGRLNETWFRAEREGVYYGQCSELCGNGHPYMPIQIRVTSEAAYAAWLAEAKQKYPAAAAAPASGGVTLAAND